MEVISALSSSLEALPLLPDLDDLDDFGGLDLAEAEGAEVADVFDPFPGDSEGPLGWAAAFGADFGVLPDGCGDELSFAFVCCGCG